VRFAPDLKASTDAADARLARVLARIDDHIARSGLDAEVLRASRPAGMRPAERLTRLDLRRDGVGTVLWATGYRRPYPWLQVPVLDGAGEIRHRRGVTPVEGLYVMGQRFQYRRDSNFIDGVRHDAAYLAGHIADRAPRTPASARPTVHC
jgi:putative flavoprotein involved in K+ transport